MIPLARPLVAAALLIAPFALSVGVRAETLDLNQASCSDFLAMSEGDRAQLSLWLAGYFSGNAMRPLLDLEKIVAAPAELGALCEKTPQAPLIGPETRAIFIAAP